MNEVLKKLLLAFTVTFLLYSVMLVGSASIGIANTQVNSRKVIHHYSVDLPLSKGWKLTQYKYDNNALYLTKKINSLFCSMLFTGNRTVGARMKSWAAQKIADDYRAGEEWNMILQGAKTGDYELEDVVKGEEMIGAKKFYTMEYVQVRSDSKLKVYLYLYFHKDKQINNFVVSNYTECCFPLNSPITPTFKQEFIDTLRTIKISQ